MTYVLKKGVNVTRKENFRDFFPIYKARKAEIFLDSAATTHKPQCVIDRISNFYAHENAPVLRSMYTSGELATAAYEQARETIAQYIGAQACEVVFNAGATAGINAIAASWGPTVVKAGDNIIVSQMEHHANFLPWQRLAREQRALLHIVPITADGQFDLHKYEEFLSPQTKIVAITHASNVLGTTNNVAEIAQKAHAVGASVLVDAAQSIPHQRIDVRALGADFLVFSGHKMLGPTGIGVLYINKRFHEQLKPYQLGGGMAQQVCDQTAQWVPAPHKFEAGTPPIAQALGLATAFDFLAHTIGFDKLREHERLLMRVLIDGLQELSRVHILGPIEQLKQQGHLVSFIVDGIHAHDVAAFFDAQDVSIAVRAGQQCAQPLHVVLNIPASVRISLHCYNTLEEIVYVLHKLKELVGSTVKCVG